MKKLLVVLLFFCPFSYGQKFEKMIKNYYSKTGYDSIIVKYDSLTKVVPVKALFNIKDVVVRMDSDLPIIVTTPDVMGTMYVGKKLFDYIDERNSNK